MEKHGVVEGVIIRSIISIHHGVDFQSETSSPRLGVRLIAVVEDEEQALVTHNIRIVAMLRTVMSVTINIDKRSQILSITFRPVSRPCQDILWNLIPCLAMVGDELINLGTGEIPNMFKLLFRFIINRGICGTERPHPIITTYLIKTGRCQMKLTILIHSTKP